MVEPFLFACFSVVILIFSNMSFTDPMASIFSPGFGKERHYVGIFSTRLALSVGSLFCHFQKFTNDICWVCKHRNGEVTNWPGKIKIMISAQHSSNNGKNWQKLSYEKTLLAW